MDIAYKSFPKDLPVEFEKVIKLISFDMKNVKIEGTYKIRGLLYYSDVDCFEKVVYKPKSKSDDIEDAMNEFTQKFQMMIKNLSQQPNVYIMKIIASADEKDKPMKWTVKNVMDGRVSDIQLRHVFNQPDMIKVDVTAFINSVYVDFSNTFQFYYGSKLMNKYKLFQKSSLDADIKKYKKEANYFKMAKRIFIRDDNLKLIPLFNSDLGAINQVMSNIDTLIAILEDVSHPSFKNIHEEIDGFINRLNVLYNTKLIRNDKVIEMIKQAETLTGRKQLIRKLKRLYDDLNPIVQIGTKKYLKNHSIDES